MRGHVLTITKKRRPWSVLLALPLAAVLLAGCGGSAAEGEGPQPAVVEQVKGSDAQRVTLTAEAAHRIDIRTAPARGEAGRTVIPYAAVLYDPDGRTWTFTRPGRLTFMREDITVARVDGDDAVLAKGPAAGTQVVTVGATELWGVVYGGIEED